jgi:hypothetical protein
MLVLMNNGEMRLVDRLLYAVHAYAGHPPKDVFTEWIIEDGAPPMLKVAEPAPEHKGKPVTKGATKACAECGKQFAAATSTVCCSDECREARLKRQKNAHYERSKRQTAAARKTPAPRGPTMPAGHHPSDPVERASQTARQIAQEEG